MKPTRSVLAPAAVLVVAVVTGGWFLQEGVEQDRNVYLQVRLFEEVVERVSEQYVDEVDRSTLYENAIDGLLGELDPNTSFIGAAEYESFRIRTEGDYGGVGLEIQQQDGWVTVVTPIPGSPATRAGIRAGDRFVTIEGESAAGWDTDQVADRLRGEPGTTVDVEVRRVGVDEPIPFTLERAEIRLRAVPFATLLEGEVAYVPLQLFQESSTDEIRAAVDSLRAEGARKLVLDLRGNPGGLLEQGIGVTDLFLESEDVVVETRGRGPGQSETFRAPDRESFSGLPTVVLVDESSASASEIVAGALQDHDRAVVVGNTTFGKGSVQTLFRLSGGNVLRLTTARWYTPVGRGIQMDHERQMSRALGENGTLALSGQLVERPDTAERPAFRSLGGRVLLGGGGITPDVIVLPDTLTSPEQRAVRALFRQAGALNLAIFNYAARYVQEHPELDRDFRLTAADLADFHDALGDRGVEVDDRVLADAERFLRHQLERQIAGQAWGEAGEFDRVRRDDRQLLEALGLLTRSANQRELLRAARTPAYGAPSAGPDEAAATDAAAGGSSGAGDASGADASDGGGGSAPDGDASGEGSGGSGG